MTQKDSECREPVSFSDEELRQILSITKTHSKSRQKTICVDRKKCDAIFLFIEEVLMKVQRKRIRKLIVYGAKKITLTKSILKPEFEISFKNKEIRKKVLEKLCYNTHLKSSNENRKDGPVLHITPGKEMTKK